MEAEGLVSAEEDKEAEQRQRPRSAVIFEVIRREGETELERTAWSLFWSAFAAGLSMVFSLVTTGIIRSRLPDAEWRPLVSSFGYTIGFLIVILGRQQLFTENTLTPLLPVFNDPKLWRIRLVARAWAIILFGNLLGGAIAAACVTFGEPISPAARHAFDQLAQQTVGPSFNQIFVKAVFAGWIIALMVWLIPLAEQLTPVIIILLTWIVSAGELEHVIAGSIEAMYGAFRGATTWGDAVHFFVPTLLGNIVGGVAFVAAISSAEIAAERSRPRQPRTRRVR